MKEYRIVKETTTNTNITRYYIEEKKKFLIWEWWDRETYYSDFCHAEVAVDYITYQRAKDEIAKLTDKIVREVVE